jgi:preprotein translocase subunit SecA
MRHYDVQLIGGIVLHQGKIAEMRTGEGKTLVATLPVYLNALAGQGVHVVTVNDYLAKRDSEWMGRLYNFLGLSVGIIVNELNDRQRRESYNSDITYGTNNEFGFDYLRDNMKFDLKDYVQRPHFYAIVDECDSILIDEARTPLIISGPAEDSTDKYATVDKIIPSLKPEVHFTIEEKSKTAFLTEEGNTKVEELLGIDNLYEPHNVDLLHHVLQALKAHHLYKVDVDYMIKDGEVIIVDEFTGRLMEGRRWSDGLHQAVEAKERVKVRNENQTLATITFQNYFRMYKKLAGMTGTAETEAAEFEKIYKLLTVVIPTNKPIRRTDQEDIIFKTEQAKFNAIAKDIQERNKKGQPVLVGTVSIEKSERLSHYLKGLNVRHNVLNAKHHEKEAEIVAQAGRKAAVTIATNMAGRGTDIVLGGNPEFLAKVHHQADSTQDIEVLNAKYKDVCAKEKEEVIAAGGLCIVGTERHESRRIDNQLRGRSGRQGDPGESQFYLSLDDHLMVVFNGERIKKIMTTLRVPDDEPITAPMVSRAIEGAQKKVEAHNFDIRKHLLDYDDVMNKQRTTIYGLRRRVLEGGAEAEQITKEMMGELTSDILDLYADEKLPPKEWNLEALNKALNQQFGVTAEFTHPVTINDLIERIKNLVMTRFEQQKKELGPFFDQAQRMITLQAIDQKWKEHLQQIDHLREGINLRAHAQKDPLIEYKREAFSAFESMNILIRQDAMEKLFKVQVSHQYVERAEAQADAEEISEEIFGGLMPQAPQQMTMSHESAQGFAGQTQPMGAPMPAAARTPVQNQMPKVGRNDPCPCGSGKKYKKCHGANS